MRQPGTEWTEAWGRELSASTGVQGETGQQVEEGQGCWGGAVCLSVVHPLWVDEGVDVSQGGGSSLLSPGSGKCELTGRGGGLRGAREGLGAYLDLFGMKGHNKGKE